MTTKQKQHQKRAAAAKKRNRVRALPAPNAFAYTISDAQSMGGPCKTKIYDLDKQLKADGKQLLFKDLAGRTMVYGDILRELCGVKEEVTA